MKDYKFKYFPGDILQIATSNYQRNCIDYTTALVVECVAHKPPNADHYRLKIISGANITINIDGINRVGAIWVDSHSILLSREELGSVLYA